MVTENVKKEKAAVLRAAFFVSRGKKGNINIFDLLYFRFCRGDFFLIPHVFLFITTLFFMVSYILDARATALIERPIFMGRGLLV